MDTILSGAAFGAAMAAAGFTNPAVIISQLKFENWHMLRAFLAATASSAFIYAVAERLGFVRLPPRSSSPLGLFSRYDGNVVGGALLGAGMALSGSCPGTLYAQLAVGSRTGLYALAGAVAGGILWTGPLVACVKARRDAARLKPEPATVADLLGLSRVAMLLVFEAACVVAVTTTVAAAAEGRVPAPGPLVPPGVLGGLLIGLAQLVSLVLRRSMLGVSGSFEDLGNAFWALVAAGPTPRSCGNALFAAALTAGAWGLVTAVPALRAATGPVVEVAPPLAAAGGLVMAVGSRLAGGCTSGHGISGLSLLSVSSLVTMASTFAAGAIVAPLVH